MTLTNVPNSLERTCVSSVLSGGFIATRGLRSQSAQNTTALTSKSSSRPDHRTPNSPRPSRSCGEPRWASTDSPSLRGRLLCRRRHAVLHVSESSQADLRVVCAAPWDELCSDGVMHPPTAALARSQNTSPTVPSVVFTTIEYRCPTAMGSSCSTGPYTGVSSTSMT